jgi:D-3-phosphoglycerate dehydrogenase
MTNTVEALVLDLLEWLGRQDRSYEETMDAWRTSCPRLPVWEEATDLGLVSIEGRGRAAHVIATPVGLAFLQERRPEHRR